VGTVAVMLTLLDAESQSRAVLTVDPAHPERSIGWERKPEGLCRANVCVPVPAGPLDLEGVAKALGRPLVVNHGTGVAAMGASPAERGAALLSGQAPDFSLQDLSGKTWTLSEFRGRKVVLYAYASW
jgi:AhpC/TSA family